VDSSLQSSAAAIVENADDSGGFVFLSEAALRAIRDIGEAESPSSSSNGLFSPPHDKPSDGTAADADDATSNSSFDRSAIAPPEDGGTATGSAKESAISSLHEIPAGGSRKDSDGDREDDASSQLSNDRWMQATEQIEKEVAGLERDIESKEALEDALIRRGREVMRMHAKVASLSEEIRRIKQERDSLLAKLQDSKPEGKEADVSPSARGNTDQQTDIASNSDGIVSKLHQAEANLKALHEHRASLEEQLREATKSAQELQHVRLELDTLRRQYALQVRLVAQVKHESQQALESRDKELHRLRLAVQQTRAQARRLRAARSHEKPNSGAGTVSTDQALEGNSGEANDKIPDAHDQSPNAARKARGSTQAVLRFSSSPSAQFPEALLHRKQEILHRSLGEVLLDASSNVLPGASPSSTGSAPDAKSNSNGLDDGV